MAYGRLGVGFQHFGKGVVGKEAELPFGFFFLQCKTCTIATARDVLRNGAEEPAYIVANLQMRSTEGRNSGVVLDIVAT